MTEVTECFAKNLNLFIRSHHDNDHIICDQAQHFAFHQKRDTLQYNAFLTIAGPIRGTSKEKL